MTVDEAKKHIEGVIEEYKSKLEALGMVTSVEHEYETKNYDECSYEDAKLAIVTVYLTVKASGMGDGEGMCFGILSEVNKSREVNDEKLQSEIIEYKFNLDELIAALEGSDDRAEFIRSESRRVEEENKDRMQAFENKIKKLELASKAIAIVGGVLVLGVIILIFVL